MYEVMFIFNTGKTVSKFFNNKEEAKWYLETYQYTPGCVECFITELPQ
jgi:hypothetical protein